MNVLIMGEESQEICIAFLEKGHNAFSVDLQQCSGNRRDRHLVGDMWETFDKGVPGTGEKWDFVIVHIVCTYMCNSGALRLYIGGKKKNGIDPVRWANMIKSTEDFNRALKLPCKKIVLENPIMHKWARELITRPWDQTIQPYEFGHPESKRTCLWVKGVPLLKATDYADWKSYKCRCGYIFEAELGKYGCPNCGGHYVAKPIWDNQCATGSGQSKLGKGCGKKRSKTYTGWAKAMADQWG